MNGSGTCEQGLHLTSATPHVNGTIAHGNALKHVIRDLFHVFLSKVKTIVLFLLYKPGIKILLDIMW